MYKNHLVRRCSMSKSHILQCQQILPQLFIIPSNYTAESFTNLAPQPPKDPSPANFHQNFIHPNTKIQGAYSLYLLHWSLSTRDDHGGGWT